MDKSLYLGVVVLLVVAVVPKARVLAKATNTKQCAKKGTLINWAVEGKELKITTNKAGK
jgi:hypothetical protein